MVLCSLVQTNDQQRCVEQVVGESTGEYVYHTMTVEKTALNPNSGSQFTRRDKYIPNHKLSRQLQNGSFQQLWRPAPIIELLGLTPIHSIGGVPITSHSSSKPLIPKTTDRKTPEPEKKSACSNKSAAATRNTNPNLLFFLCC